MRRHWMFTAPLLTCSLTLSARGEVTTGSLLRRMTDMAALARFPDPPYKTIQFSSYDRRSVAPYVDGWYANSDGFGGEPIPGFLAVLKEPDASGIGRYLMAEVNGPGAIVRTWTAAINGTVAVYLDGADQPVYDGDATEFMQRIYARFARQASALAAGAEDWFKQNMACYFPIPFAKSLRIEWTGNMNELHFYHIEARTYPAGTRVTAFSPQDVITYDTEIRSVHPVLASPDGSYAPSVECRQSDIDVEVGPGAREELLRIEEPGAVHLLTLKVEADDVRAALRQAILKGYFDGAPHPQIEAPVGDFFGSGPGVAPYDSLPMTVRPDGSMACRFVMPFAHSAVFAVDNRGTQTIRVTGSAEVAGPLEGGESPMHFHAKWRVDHDLLAGGGDMAFDLPYLMARGKGVLVGVAAMILNPSGIPTSGGNWWGEGDEKVWVDDDVFPSLFGTGSEDYYNYAWSWPHLFAHAYCAQPLDTGPDNRGFCANNRWHILDALPFEQNVAFFMELFHHTPTPGLTYARAAYFYAYPEVRDDFRPIQTADLMQGLELPRDWQPVAAGAARDAVFYQAEDTLVAGSDHAKVEEGEMWSAGRMVRWTPQREGEGIAFDLDVPEDGRYQMVATFVHSPAGGRVAPVVNGVVGEPAADLHTPHLTMLRNAFFDISGGPVELKAGRQRIALRALSGAGTEIGVDFLWLIRR